MLLYSLLHLAGVKAVDSNYQTPGALAVTLDDIKQFRQLDSKTARPSRIPPDQRRGNHHRPAGPGRGNQRGHGDGPMVAGCAFQQAGFRHVRLQRLRHLR